MSSESNNPTQLSDAGSRVGRRRGRFSSEAYDYLRTRILRGQTPPGATLAEGPLALELGMSRTPVRQALRQLLQDGLVEVGRRRQITVRRFSPTLRHEIFKVREALERIAVAQACETMALADVDQLRLLLLRQQRAANSGSAAEFIDLDEEFHLSIASAVQLDIVTKFLTELRAFIRMLGLEAVSHPGRMTDVLAEHGEIVDALEQRAEARALDALGRHLAATERTLGVAASERHRQPCNHATEGTCGA